MRIIFYALFLYSCSQLPSKTAEPEVDNLVTIKTALDQSQMSYLKGCVDAFNIVKMPKPFETCRDKSLLHRQEIESIVDQVPSELR